MFDNCYIDIYPTIAICYTKLLFSKVIWESHCFSQAIKLMDTKNEQGRIPVFPHTIYKLIITFLKFLK